MSVLKPVYNIYQLKMYPILNILTFGCRFPCRADNAAYPHDGRADKRRYRHDRRADSHCLRFRDFCKKAKIKQTYAWLFKRCWLKVYLTFKIYSNDSEEKEKP